MKKFFDKGLVIFKNNKLVDFFTRAETWAEKIGLICLYIGMPLVGIAVCINHDRFFDVMLDSAALVAVGFIIVCLLLGYIAEKMLEYVRPSIDQAKTNIVNGDFFDVLAFLFGIITLVTGIATVVLLFSGEFTDAATAAAVCILALYFAVMLLSPKKMLNVSVQESATPAQSLISLVAFLIKAAYRMVPVMFGVAMVLCVINGIDLAACSRSVFDYKLTASISTFLISALLPLIAYFLFLTYYFILDWCMSLFRIADAVENKNKTK